MPIAAPFVECLKILSYLALMAMQDFSLFAYLHVMVMRFLNAAAAVRSKIRMRRTATRR